jgi:hypothetical protein
VSFLKQTPLVVVVVINHSTAISYCKPLKEEVLSLLNLSDWIVTIQLMCSFTSKKKRFDAHFSPILINSVGNFSHTFLILDCISATIS